ncbi:hypothetical protein BZZ01_18210 [Nostocales cyanobacterium HT-58-2]|nr:hypothetical protein BZZ01_18210 [Nostocales cyanobacterium HT-58-2]
MEDRDYLIHFYEYGIPANAGAINLNENGDITMLNSGLAQKCDLKIFFKLSANNSAEFLASDFN